MSTEERRHVAPPKLYGAPAYSRPVVDVGPTYRPFDPDDLPLVVAMTDEERTRIERDLASESQARTPPPPPGLTARPFSLRMLSDRLRGPRD